MTKRFTVDEKGYFDKKAMRYVTIDYLMDLVNGQDQKIKELEQELFTEKVKRFEDNLAEYGGLNDKEAWQRKFGMSRREANKKAGITDWELIPEV